MGRAGGEFLLLHHCAGQEGASLGGELGAALEERLVIRGLGFSRDRQRVHGERHVIERVARLAVADPAQRLAEVLQKRIQEIGFLAVVFRHQRERQPRVRAYGEI